MLLLTADEGRRGGRTVPLKRNANDALLECPSVRHVIVARNTGGNVDMEPRRDHWWDTLCNHAAEDCPLWLVNRH